MTVAKNVAALTLAADGDFWQPAVERLYAPGRVIARAVDRANFRGARRFRATSKDDGRFDRSSGGNSFDSPYLPAIQRLSHRCPPRVPVWGVCIAGLRPLKRRQDPARVCPMDALDRFAAIGMSV